MAKKPSDITLGVAVYDLHYPQHHKPTLAAIGEFLSHNKVDLFLFGGDQLNNDCISHHNKGKGIYKLPGQYQRETFGFDRDVLRMVEGLLPKQARRVWITGNHDNWEYELVENQPELQGTVERDLLLHLQDRGWEVIPFGRSFKYGELTFVHGQELRSNGANHAKRAVEIFCTNVLYGHFHSPQTFTKILPTDSSRKWQAHCSPIAGDVNPLWMEGNPSAWLNGFTIVEFRKNGEFNLYPVIIINGQFSYGGRLYGGKK